MWALIIGHSIMIMALAVHMPVSALGSRSGVFVDHGSMQQHMICADNKRQQQQHRKIEVRASSNIECTLKCKRKDMEALVTPGGGKSVVARRRRRRTARRLRRCFCLTPVHKQQQQQQWWNRDSRSNENCKVEMKVEGELIQKHVSLYRIDKKCLKNVIPWPLTNVKL